MTDLNTLVAELELGSDAALEALVSAVANLSVEASPRLGSGPIQVYQRSLTRVDGGWLALLRNAAGAPGSDAADALVPADTAPAAGRRLCLAIMRGGAAAPGGLPWQRLDLPALGGDAVAWVAPTTTAAARALHDVLPWTAPRSLREQRTTIGMGDRLGIATPGHIRAARRFAVSPVLAQQSVRENDFIGRSFEDVVGNATWAVFQEGFRAGYGADGDHLKTIPAIDVALAAGMPMITLDLTEVMRPEVADWSDAEVDAAWRELPESERARLERDYADRAIDLGQGLSVTLAAADLRRCAVMYGPALDFSREVNDHLHKHTGGAYDLEISIDETTTPTLPEHHLFIARELHHRQVTVNSLAPRFIGEFQKAIDYIGNLDEFRSQFGVHCAIARAFGGYKISVHSGSDKFAVYPDVGRLTDMRLHLKTSGTSWLEALRTLAVHDPSLYRRLHAFVLDYYPTALSFYHITADFAAIPALDSLSDAELPRLLDDANARQMLHISYGGVLQDAELAPALYERLFALEDEYAAMLEAHFVKHIGLLGAPAVGGGPGSAAASAGSAGAAAGGRA